MHYYDSYYFAPKYEFGDFIKDETVDIQILQNHASNFGCAWEEENTYSWNGLQPQHELADGFPQGSAVCNLWRSVARANRTYSIPEEEYLDYLQLAIEQLKEDSNAEIDWLAFALFQSAIINIRDGNYQQAKQNLDDIHTLENSPYAQFIVENDQDTGESRLISLCRNLVINSDQALETNIGEFLNEQAVKGRGFDWELADRSIICNLEDLSKTF
ncbi:MAG: hypothetical protein IPH82_12015 [Chloroflexi bacterium]|nr:hypothetical protein [Chloroflexota bacterium]